MWTARANRSDVFSRLCSRRFRPAISGAVNSGRPTGHRKRRPAGSVNCIESQSTRVTWVVSETRILPLLEIADHRLHAVHRLHRRHRLAATLTRWPHVAWRVHCGSDGMGSIRLDGLLTM